MNTVLAQLPQEFAKIIEAGGGIIKFLSHSEIASNSKGPEVEERNFFHLLCSTGTASQLEVALRLLYAEDPKTASSVWQIRDRR